ncbi:MAG: hypothetical protein QME74_06290 [Candidatus Edwardsbacteria bacterium]|nr:hypothetical protein [Candidatus Edwardsbacteria bacterium]
MLQIKRIAKYKAPRYPRGIYHRRRAHGAVSLAKGGAASLAMLLLLEACSKKPLGTTGPPPVMPDLLTENEARAVVNQVFANNQVGLQSDHDCVLKYSSGDSAVLNLDGFNDSLKVGYEYICGDSDQASLSPRVTQALDSARHHGGPYVRWSYQTDDGNYLKSRIQSFIDSLRSEGIF